ncbi:MAG: hypothetical protein AAF242_02235 [Bacteroidota bacterium]
MKMPASQSPKSIGYYILIGHLWSTSLALAVSLGLPALIVGLTYAFLHPILVLFLAFFGFVSGLAISWLWWSYIIPHWRIWAFNSLPEDDWVALQNKAIQYRLIWPTHSRFNQTEIRSPEVNAQIAAIEERILELREVGDLILDLELPTQSLYYLNRRRLGFTLILFTLMIVAGIVMCFESWLGLCVVVPALLIGYPILGYLPFLRDQDPIMIIDEYGIQSSLGNTLYLAWEDLDSIYISDDARELILYKKQDTEAVRFKLDYLDVPDKNQLLSLIKVYSERDGQRYMQRN